MYERVMGRERSRYSPTVHERRKFRFSQLLVDGDQLLNRVFMVRLQNEKGKNVQFATLELQKRNARISESITEIHLLRSVPLLVFVRFCEKSSTDNAIVVSTVTRFSTRSLKRSEWMLDACIAVQKLSLLSICLPGMCSHCLYLDVCSPSPDHLSFADTSSKHEYGELHFDIDHVGW